MDIITLAVAKKLAESGAGTPGKDGKSAYEIAVSKGFEGTEEEWLESLKGEAADISSLQEAINNKPGEKTAVGGEIFNDYTDNIASGKSSHAEGYKTTASGYYSHTEGRETEAGGESSHAEGNRTEASGDGSHAEGGVTEASGAYAYAGGYMTIASGVHSHAEGTGTIAASDAQHVQGQYNIEDADGVYAHIVGWGTSDGDRKNINTIDTNGNGWFAGKVSAGTAQAPAEPTEANDLITKKYFEEHLTRGVAVADASDESDIYICNLMHY